MTETPVPWVLAIDPGFAYLGWAAIDRQTMLPVRLGTIVFDDWFEMGTAGGTSRLSERGMRRRARRTNERRRSRRKQLDDALRTHLGDDLFAESHAADQLRDVWHARARAADGTATPAEVITAIRHLAFSRGFQSGWARPLAHDREHRQSATTVKRVTAILGEQGGTIGQAAWAQLSSGHAVRAVGKHKNREESKMVLGLAHERVDAAHELQVIWRAASAAYPDLFTDAALEPIWRLAIHQARSEAPDRGACASGMPGRTRALAGLKIAREFKIENYIANLRIDGEPLTAGQRDTVRDHLLEAKQVTRKELGQLLGVKRINMDDAWSDKGNPTGKLRDLPARMAALDDQDVDLLVRIAAHEEWLEDLDDATRARLVGAAGSEPKLEDALDKIAGKVGARVAFSEEALVELTETMRDYGLDLRGAADALGYRPELIVEDEAGHPGIRRMMQMVDRLLPELEERMGGAPSGAIIESISMKDSPVDREAMIERRRREARRRLELEAAQIESERGLARLKALARWRQGGICLYCGAEVADGAGDLDHIQPRARGGGSTRGNLALVCADCNRSKGDRLVKDAFPGRLEEIVERARGWQYAVSGTKVATEKLPDGASGIENPPTPAELTMLERFGDQVAARLRAERPDEENPVALHATGYASRHLRSRLAQRYGWFTEEQLHKVEVLPGRATRSARDALRMENVKGAVEGQRSTSLNKDRADLRNHGVDAAILGSLYGRDAENVADLHGLDPRLLKPQRLLYSSARSLVRRDEEHRVTGEWRSLDTLSGRFADPGYRAALVQRLDELHAGAVPYCPIVRRPRGPIHKDSLIATRNRPDGKRVIVRSIEVGKFASEPEARQRKVVEQMAPGPQREKLLEALAEGPLTAQRIKQLKVRGRGPRARFMDPVVSGGKIKYTETIGDPVDLGDGRTYENTGTHLIEAPFREWRIDEAYRCRSLPPTSRGLYKNQVIMSARLPSETGPRLARVRGFGHPGKSDVEVKMVDGAPISTAIQLLGAIFGVRGGTNSGNAKTRLLLLSILGEVEALRAPRDTKWTPIAPDDRSRWRQIVHEQIGEPWPPVQVAPEG